MLEIVTATAAERACFAEWAAAEGWNPGHVDMDCFAAQDPGGFFLGRVAGEPVSAVSVVNYGADFAFLGFYIVQPAWRGRGFGLATWQAGLVHAGRRTVGLDGVLQQQPSYRKSGFDLAYRNIRFGGRLTPSGPPDPRVRAPDAGALTALVAYDAACFPAERPRFLEAWLGAPGHVARMLVEDGRLRGFGVARPCRDGIKIAPLLADDRACAEALLDGLLDAVGAALGFIDLPEPNAAAVALAEGRGLTPGFETARMYTGPVRPVALDRLYGVASFELG